MGPPLVFPLLYSSYAEQQYDEVLRALDYATSVDVPVLMGDFNNGPAVPGGVSWVLPFHYGVLAARGFYSPYVLRDGRCTWCLENAQAVVFFPGSFILDNIFITTNTRDRVRSVEVYIVVCMALSISDVICIYYSNTFIPSKVYVYYNSYMQASCPLLIYASSSLQNQTHQKP